MYQKVLSIIKEKSLYIFLLLSVPLFWIKGISNLDPDFGWHLRMGQIILEKGLPKTDPFSYTMPSYPFVDHEWLTNVIIAVLYPHIGMIGLGLFFALLATLALFILTRISIKKFDLPPIILTASVMMDLAGIRPQVITWALISIILYVVLSDKNWGKWKYFLPLFYIVWVNLHGGFVIGIAVLFFATLLKFIEQRKIIFSEVIICLLSLIATLINPYFIRIWWEVFMQLSDRSLSASITEWEPSIYSYNLAFLCLSMISAIIIYKFRKHFSLPQLGIYLAFLVASFLSIRHMAFLGLISIPLLSLGINAFTTMLTNDRLGLKRLNLAYKYFSLGSLFIFIISSFICIYQFQTLREREFYPTSAIKFLQQQKLQGRIFADYNWGGYLDWKMPEEKVFIDGRMPSWRINTQPINESEWAHKDYRSVVYSGADINTLFNKFNIRLVLWPTPHQSNNNFPSKINNYLTTLGVKSSNAPKTKAFDERLKDNHWKIVYQDSVATVYQKPE